MIRFLENNYLKGDLPFVSSAPNSIFRFSPQRPEPPKPTSGGLSPAVVPSVIAGVILLILTTVILIAFSQKRKKDRLRAERQLAADNAVIETPKMSEESIESADLTEGDDSLVFDSVHIVAVGPNQEKDSKPNGQ